MGPLRSLGCATPMTASETSGRSARGASLTALAAKPTRPSNARLLEAASENRGADHRAQEVAAHRRCAGFMPSARPRASLSLDVDRAVRVTLYVGVGRMMNDPVRRRQEPAPSNSIEPRRRRALRTIAPTPCSHEEPRSSDPPAAVAEIHPRHDPLAYPQQPSRTVIPELVLVSEG